MLVGLRVASSVSQAWAVSICCNALRESGIIRF